MSNEMDYCTFCGQDIPPDIVTETITVRIRPSNNYPAPHVCKTTRDEIRENA